MKKIFSLELVLLFLIFATGIARCEDSFYIGTQQEETSQKETNFPQTTNIKEAKPISQDTNNKASKKLKNIKSKKAKKQKNDKNPQGYWGTLPNVSRDFEYKRKTSIKPDKPDAYIPEGELEQDNLKPAPTDDTLFLDVIVKKEKASNYVNDIQKVKYALNNLKKCIEENGDIQHFNGCVNVIELYSKNLQSKYENKSDSLRESYIDILNTNYHAKVLGNLLYDANYYSRYVPVQEGQYSKENIKNKKQDLLKRINKTLFLIANET